MFYLVAFPIMLVEFVLSETLHRLRQRVSFLDDKPLVLTTFVEGDYYEGSPGHNSKEFINVDKFMEYVIQDYNPHSRSYRAAECIPYLESIKTRIDVKSYILDSFSNYDDVHVIAIESEKEHRERSLNERRKQLESIASEFAYFNNISMDSLDFITALVKEVKRIRTQRDHWNNPETRMEEWMDRQYVGGGVDLYFDDLNFENDRYSERINTLEDVLEWVKMSCPLMYMQWKERRAARRKKKR